MQDTIGHFSITYLHGVTFASMGKAQKVFKINIPYIYAQAFYIQ